MVRRTAQKTPDADTATAAFTRALREFLATEVAGGVVLLAATLAALVWANSPWRATYDEVWHTPAIVGIGRWALTLDLRHWVNDGLMAIFFLVVGLEVKREFLQGELRDRRKALLPVLAALGGMVVPAALYASMNVNGAGAAGWGIPMATDIAFALGVLALVAPSLPGSLRVLLLALAIVDDIGAIVVIAIFYSSSIEPVWLVVAAAIAAAVFLLRRVGVSSPPVFVALGVGLWVAVHASGVHATIAGVAMGLLVPATPRLDRQIVESRADELLDVFTPAAARQTSVIARRSVSELEWIEHSLHPVSSLVIVPIFALANAGVNFGAADLAAAAGSAVTGGVLVGLVVGKTFGISVAAWLAVRLGLADLAPDVRWRELIGVAMLGGIGFTVSLFITELAFASEDLVGEAKVGIFAASLAASIGGAMLLRHRSGAPS